MIDHQYQEDRRQNVAWHFNLEKEPLQPVQKKSFEAVERSVAGILCRLNTEASKSSSAKVITVFIIRILTDKACFISSEAASSR